MGAWSTPPPPRSAGISLRRRQNFLLGSFREACLCLIQKIKSSRKFNLAPVSRTGQTGRPGTAWHGPAHANAWQSGRAVPAHVRHASAQARPGYQTCRPVARLAGPHILGILGCNKKLNGSCRDGLRAQPLGPGMAQGVPRAGHGPFSLCRA